MAVWTYQSVWLLSQQFSSWVRLLIVSFLPPIPSQSLHYRAWEWEVNPVSLFWACNYRQRSQITCYKCMEIDNYLWCDWQTALKAHLLCYFMLMWHWKCSGEPLASYTHLYGETYSLLESDIFWMYNKLPTRYWEMLSNLS